jgi:intracellular sulfur oxidation DsrE/DsrF family protein
MSEERKVSAEMQSAFVDGQLDAAEWDRIAAQHERDAQLREDLGALRMLKDMVRHAYAVPPAPSRRAPGRAGPGWMGAAAAGVVFAAAGWFGQAWWSSAPKLDPASAYVLQGQPVALDRGHVLVHVSTGEREALVRALDEIEDLLWSARREHRSVQVEVVVNRTGLQLVQAKVSPYAARIARLRTEYPNLSFIACGQTLRRLGEAGRSVELLPGTEVAPSALDQVVKRLQDGWIYVRV